MGDFSQYYQYIKFIHIVFVISWMAALLYLPRLFVYHSKHFDSSEYTKVVEVQERKLYRGIAWPGMVLTLVSGLLMIVLYPDLLKNRGWMHAKLTLVFFLIIFHFFCGRMMVKLRESKVRSERFFRVINEVPTVIMVGIVFLVVIRPF